MPTHAEKRVVPWRPEQLFDIVADVGKYPEFLPWCTGARVRESSERELIVDLIVGFKGINEKFTSRVTLDRPGLCIDVAYLDGPFRYLNNHWEFHESGSGGCEIDFFVDFEFRSRLLQRVIGLLFNEAVRRMVSAFEARAAVVYGPPEVTGGRK